MKTLSRFHQRIRALDSFDVLSLTVWLLILGMVESVGRDTRTDIGDGVVLTVVGTLVALTAVAHEVRSIAWVRALRRALSRLRPTGLLDLQLGVDLRGSPPVTRELPPLFWKPAAVLAGACALALTLGPWMPIGLRALIPWSYTLYLLALGTLWVSLMAGALFFACITFCFLHDEFVRAHPDPSRRSAHPEFLGFAALGGVLLGGALFTPEWLPPTVITLGFGLPALGFLRPGGTGIDMLWRRPRAGGVVRSMSWHRSLAIELSTCLLGALALLLLGRGQFLFGGGERFDPRLPITSLLGLCFTWAAVGAALVVGAIALRALFQERSFRRARRTRVVVRLEGLRGRARRELVRRLAAVGIAVRRSPRRPDLRVVASAPAEGAADDWQASFERSRRPRVAAAEDAPSALLYAGQRRLRRRLLVGLRLGLRLASRRHDRPGSGWWIGFQHWFVYSLSRDESVETHDLRRDAIIDDGLGPRYWRLFPPRARTHFLEVSRALDVGLIFVEDGVRFPELRRVLETLFEVYDIHSGRTRVEDRHFTGHPGVRVVLHEFEFDHPFRSELYPEPDYEGVGRGRILHVFRDRSDELEFLELPVDIDSVSPRSH